MPPETRELETRKLTINILRAPKPDSAALKKILDEAVACHHAGDFPAAEKLYRQILKADPQNFNALHLLGVCFSQQMQLDAAIDFISRAVQIFPCSEQAFYNLANALSAALRFAEAKPHYEKAIALKPDYADAHWNYAVNLLLHGEFERGWQEYEWRWHAKNISTSGRRTFADYPQWTGAEDVRGKTILLHSEQGLGDCIQFSRYATLLAARGARVHLQVPPPLVSLLTQLTGVSSVSEKSESKKHLSTFDYHCPLLSLPLAFKTTLASIPASGCYIHADENKLRVWSKRLGKSRRPRVGLVWSGGTDHQNDHFRTLRLADLLPHLPPQFEYISLQKEVRAQDAAALSASAAVRHCGDALHDFSDTAALCELMDVIVSVDTSVVHLGGALGKETWLLLPYYNDWRWLLARTDSPWYPSMKLYRCTQHGNWQPVLQQLHRDLTAHLVTTR